MRMVVLITAIILAMLTNEALLKEYGDPCDTDLDCISQDYENPLVCYNSSEPTTTSTLATTTIEDTTTESLTTPISTSTVPTEDTTTDDTTTDDTTTDDPDSFLALIFQQDSIQIEDDMSSYKAYEGVNESRNIVLKFQKSAEILSAGICGCETEMMWDSELKRCVSPPLKTCDITVKPPGETTKTCSSFSKCYPNPNPEILTGLCYCETDAVLVMNSTACKLSHGSNRCEKPSDCDAHNLLTCNSNGTCICLLEELQKWNPKENRCAYVAGAPCIKKPPFPDPICVERAECVENVCICNDGYVVEASTRECKVSWNGSCQVSSDCHHYFHCSDNKCTCPVGEVYYEETGRCHLPEGSPCDADTDACIRRANCVNETCRCENGFEVGNDIFTCNALYGSPCSAEIPCHSSYYLDTCDNSVGTCECKAHYVYNSESKRCVGYLNEECSNDQDCMQHAICHERRCTCGGDLIPSDNLHSCYGRHGHSCTDIECYPKHYLGCDNETQLCTCARPEEWVYDEEQESCFARVGRGCAASADGIKCVDGAMCKVDDKESGSTKCQCQEGFDQTQDGLCEEAKNNTGSPVINGSFWILVILYYCNLALAQT